MQFILRGTVLYGSARSKKKNRKSNSHLHISHWPGAVKHQTWPSSLATNGSTRPLVTRSAALRWMRIHREKLWGRRSRLIENVLGWEQANGGGDGLLYGRDVCWGPGGCPHRKNPDTRQVPWQSPTLIESNPNIQCRPWYGEGVARLRESYRVGTAIAKPWLELCWDAYEVWEEKEKETTRLQGKIACWLGSW